MPGLVDDFRDKLGSLIDKYRIGSGYVDRADGICGAVFEQQRYQGEDGIHQKTDDDQVHDQESNDSLPHGEDCIGLYANKGVCKDRICPANPSGTD